MRKEHGLTELIKQHKGRVNKRILTELLLADLRNCKCLNSNHKCITHQFFNIYTCQLFKNSIKYFEF